MAQFLRTATISTEHLALKSLYVFDLRVYDQDMPILTGTVRFDDGWDRRLWIDPDGLFEIEGDFEKTGDYWGTIEVPADSLEPVSGGFRVVYQPSARTR